MVDSVQPLKDAWEGTEVRRWAFDNYCRLFAPFKAWWLAENRNGSASSRTRAVGRGSTPRGVDCSTLPGRVDEPPPDGERVTPAIISFHTSRQPSRRKSPATLDFAADGMVGKGVTIAGIYKVEGDTLTVCLAIGDTRPAKARETTGINSPAIRTPRPPAHLARLSVQIMTDLPFPGLGSKLAGRGPSTARHRVRVSFSTA
jgi:hypothetical protein